MNNVAPVTKICLQYKKLCPIQQFVSNCRQNEILYAKRIYFLAKKRNTREKYEFITITVAYTGVHNIHIGDEIETTWTNVCLLVFLPFLLLFSSCLRGFLSIKMRTTYRHIVQEPKNGKYKAFLHSFSPISQFQSKCVALKVFACFLQQIKFEWIDGPAILVSFVVIPLESIHSNFKKIFSHSLVSICVWYFWWINIYTKRNMNGNPMFNGVPLICLSVSAYGGSQCVSYSKSDTKSENTCSCYMSTAHIKIKQEEMLW